ncbi:MAG: MauE/DoxX family redox-associated membrane protein [Planctomycetota bacterium]
MRCRETCVLKKVWAVLKSPWLTWVSSIAVGAVFLFASYHKIADPPDFVKSIHNYCIVPGELVNLAAIYMPWFEAIAGFCLLVGILRRGSALGLGLLSLVFTVVLSYNLARGHPTICGCFGKFADGAAWTDEIKFAKMRREIYLDAALVLLSAQILVGSSVRREKLEAEPEL